MTRTEFCRSLVGSGVVVVYGEPNDKPNRCVTARGCIGTYETISDYIQSEDRFTVAYNKTVPSKDVEMVSLFDCVESLKALNLELSKFLPVRFGKV